MKLYNYHTPNYTYNLAAQSAQKAYTNLLTIGKKYRVSFNFVIDGITTATYTVKNGTSTVGTKLERITNREVTEFVASSKDLALIIELSAGNYGRLAHVDNLEIAEIFEVGEGYRFGFNGKELDQEGMGGGGSTYDYGFRIYNPNLGKFLSVDPLFSTFPYYTPYQFSGNKPIACLDLDGREDIYYLGPFKQDGSTNVQKIFNNSEASKAVVEEFKTVAKKNPADVIVFESTLSFSLAGETTSIPAHIMQGYAKGDERAIMLVTKALNGLGITDISSFHSVLKEVGEKGRKLYLVAIQENTVANGEEGVKGKKDKFDAAAEGAFILHHELELHVANDNDPSKGDETTDNKNHADFYNNDNLKNSERVQLSDQYHDIKSDSRAGVVKKSIEKSKNDIKKR